MLHKKKKPTSKVFHSKEKSVRTCVYQKKDKGCLILKSPLFPAEASLPRSCLYSSPESSQGFQQHRCCGDHCSHLLVSAKKHIQVVRPCHQLSLAQNIKVTDIVFPKQAINQTHHSKVQCRSLVREALGVSGRDSGLCHLILNLNLNCTARRLAELSPGGVPRDNWMLGVWIKLTKEYYRTECLFIIFIKMSSVILKFPCAMVSK